jgi:TatD DNase family protein
VKLKYEFLNFLNDMLLIDVHAHLDICSGTAALVKRAEAAGVKAIITAGTDIASNRKALMLSKNFAIVKAALGLYPLNALKMSDAAIDEEIKFIQKNSTKIAAVSEIGIDYQEKEWQRQQQIFERQLEIAKRIKKTVIVHSRKAEREVVETLISSGCKKAVLHAFHGSMKTVKLAIDNGYYFSIPANISRSDHFQRMVATAPLSHLLTETDAPFLSPQKGTSSEPAFVAETVKKIAEIKKLDAEETANIIYSNYQQLFSYKE